MDHVTNLRCPHLCLEPLLSVISFPIILWFRFFGFALFLSLQVTFWLLPFALSFVVISGVLSFMFFYFPLFCLFSLFSYFFSFQLGHTGFYQIKVFEGDSNSFSSHFSRNIIFQIYVFFPVAKPLNENSKLPLSVRTCQSSVTNLSLLQLLDIEGLLLTLANGILISCYKVEKIARVFALQICKTGDHSARYLEDDNPVVTHPKYSHLSNNDTTSI
jgi:hypothetical protein